MGDLVLYRSIASRSFPAVWILEELGVPWRSEMRDLKSGGNRTPEYLAISGDGKVPLLEDGGVRVSETAAICLHLADRYGYGTLAPKIDEDDRGPYLRWAVYATSQLEPAKAARNVPIETRYGAWGPGWAPIDTVLGILDAAVAGKPFLLGERFSAADIMIGAVLAMGSVAGEITLSPALSDYVARLQARPACIRAVELNWPPEVFGRSG